MNKIATGDYFGALTDIASGNVSLSQAGDAIRTHTIGAAVDGITGRNNNGLQSSKLAQTITNGTARTMGKLSEGLSGNVRDNPILVDMKTGQQSGLMQVGNAFLDKTVSKLGEKIGDKIYGRKTSGALDYLSENVLAFEAAFGGFSDISDELEDHLVQKIIINFWNK